MPDREVNDADQDTLEEQVAEAVEARTPDAERIVEVDDPDAPAYGADEDAEPPDAAELGEPI